MSFSAIQKHPRYRLSESIDVVTDAAEIHHLPAENISLGGMFLRTVHPLPAGSAVRLRLRSAGAGAATIGLVGRVVHVIDLAASEEKAHPPGIGVQFDPLSPQSELLLRRFVDGLAGQAERERLRQTPVHFAGVGDHVVVEVRADRDSLQRLWTQSLSVGGLFSEGDPPPLGALLKVGIGPLQLVGEVVHVVAGLGAGLQLRDLTGRKLEALRRFLDGTDDAIRYEEHKPGAASLGKILAAARQLFSGIDNDDGFFALGLPPTANEAEIRERVRLLDQVLSTSTPEATPPQLARLEAARRALARLEPGVVQRAGALRKEAELATQAPKIDEGAVRELLAEAFHYEKSGQRVQARAVLLRALELSPDDGQAKKRLAGLDAAAHLFRAAELMSNAENFVQGVGMANEAIPLAREAARLCHRREIRLRAVRVLAKAGEHIEATLLAEELLQAEPRDPLALQALLHLYEKAERWSDAARVGERLLRQRVGDVELSRRVKKIVERVRR